MLFFCAWLELPCPHSHATQTAKIELKSCSRNGFFSFFFSSCCSSDACRVQGGLSPASVRAQLEGSLKRLKVSSVDVFYLHWPGIDASLSSCLFGADPPNVRSLSSYLFCAEPHKARFALVLFVLCCSSQPFASPLFVLCCSSQRFALPLFFLC